MRSGTLRGEGAGSRLELDSVRAARLRAVLPRYLVLAALTVLLALGLKGLLWPPRPTPPPPPPAVADAPSLDFAVQFARAYLTYDARRPERRARSLAPFLPEQMRTDAGLSVTRGRQRVLWAHVASDQPALLGGRVITVAAAVSTQRLPIYLAVTVRHPEDGGLELVGYPSFVGAPMISRAARADAATPVEDGEVRSVVGRVLRNYLEGSLTNLVADLTDTAEVSLPTNTFTVLAVTQTSWVRGPGSGAVVATAEVEGHAGAIYTLTYELGIAYRERPYVSFVEVIPTSG